MTLRIAYNLFTQKPKQEKEDFARWIKMTGPGKGDDFFRCNGAGEMLVFSAADFEDFLEPRPDLPAPLEGELKEVVSLLAANKWPFRLHATYDESITRFLNVFEEVNREVPFKGLNWFFDHCETVTDRNLERIKALGGGIAIQHRMAYQGEYFMERYGKKAAERTPPSSENAGAWHPGGRGHGCDTRGQLQPVGFALLDGHRQDCRRRFDVSGKQLPQPRGSPSALYPGQQLVFQREWEEGGNCAQDRSADLAALTDDYFSVPEEDIKAIESVLTVVGGKIVHATEEFAMHAPPPTPGAAGVVACQLLRRLRRTAGDPRSRAHLFAGRAISRAWLRAFRPSTPRGDRGRSQPLRGVLRNGLRLFCVLKTTIWTQAHYTNPKPKKGNKQI